MVFPKVMVRRANVRFSYQAYQLLPEDIRYEILDGDLCMVSSPNTKHQRVSKKLLVALARQVEERNLGEIFVAPYDVILSDDNMPAAELGWWVNSICMELRISSLRSFLPAVARRIWKLKRKSTHVSASGNTGQSIRTQKLSKCRSGARLDICAMPCMLNPNAFHPRSFHP
jgi:hypothetical protein